MELLDNTVLVLQLTRLDSQNPNVPRFGRNQVPSIPRKRPISIFPPLSDSSVAEQSNDVAAFTTSESHQYPPTTYASSTTPTASTPLLPKQCACDSLSLINDAETHRATPLWRMTPKWPSQWSYHEILREQDRRLVWSSLSLGAAFNAAILSCGMPLVDLQIMRPENVSLALSDTQDY